MKKFLSLALLILLTLTLVLTGCKGQKEIARIDVGDTLPTQFEQGSTPDFSGVKATIIYNDQSTISVDASQLSFSQIDTSRVGKQSLTITYEDYSQTFVVEIIKKASSVPTRSLVKIEYVSGIPNNLFVGDTFHYENLMIKAVYSDNTEEVISLGKNTAVKYTEIDLNTAGKQTITFTYMNLTCTAEVNVQAIKVVKIEVDYGSIANGVDVDTIKVTKIFNNGSYARVSAADLSIKQNGAIYTITYHDAKDGDITTTIDTSVTPVVDELEIAATGYEETLIIAGDSFSDAGLACKVHYTNGGISTLSHSDFTYTIDTSVAGDATLTVTYVHNTDIKATATIPVLGISKISINASSVKNKLTVGASLKTDGIEVVITCTNGAVLVRKAESVDTTNLNTAEPNETSYITATYRGVVSEKYSIYVGEGSGEYFVLDTELPKFLTDLDNKKSLFLNQTYGYFVGDDNPFILKLIVTALDENGALVEDPDDVDFRSHFELYLGSTQLTGAELTKYASFDPENHSIQFTSEAIGQKFTIKVCPEGSPSFTSEYEVNVVDGYNIYEAWELNYLTNMSEMTIPEQSNKEKKTQLQIVHDFIRSKGGTPLTNLAAIIIHNDLTLERDDIPGAYYIDGNNAKENSSTFWDLITIFPHATEKVVGNFAIYGNYHSIYTYNLPIVCRISDNGNQEAHPTLPDLGVSNAQLFRFTSEDGEREYNERNSNKTNADINFNINDYTTTLHSLYLMDDNPSNNDEWRTERSFLGLIAMKHRYTNVNMENVNIEAFYIDVVLDYDDVVVNVNQCKFYNAYQNHFYIFNENELLQGDVNAAPGNTEIYTHTPCTLNITASKITKSGGPVILVQSKEAYQNRNAESGQIVNISEDTEIWTLVTGSEAWFTATGTTPLLSQIIQLNGAYSGLTTALGNANSFITDKGELTTQTGNYINLVMVSLDAEMAGNDVDGSFSIGDKTYLDMNDTCGTHGKATANTFVNQYAGVAPVISTYNDACLVYTGGSDPTAWYKGGNLSEGNYITVYQNGMGIVLGTNGANNAIPRITPTPDAQ